MGYTRLAIKSFSWVTAFRSFYRLLAFVRTVVLARLLSPQQFGEFGIAALALALIELLTETGINVYLVQHDEDVIEKHLNTAWAVSIMRGIIIGTVIAISSGPVAQFFNAPHAQYLLYWMALVPVVRGFINPAVIKYQKQLEFDKEFLIRSAFTLSETIASLGLAWLLKDPVALVYGLLASAVVEVIITYGLVKPRPTFAFNSNHFQEIVQNGKWVTGAGILSYFSNKSIDASIGKFLSTTSLGFYQMAYKVSVLFVDELTELVNRVAFPLYAKIGGDQKRLRKAFLKTAGVYTLVGLSSMVLLYFAAPYIIPPLLGSTWISVIPTVQLLTLMGTVIVLTTTSNPLFLATKNQRYLSAVILNQLVVILIGLALALPQPSLSKILWVSIISMAATIPLRSYFLYSILLKPRIS